MDQTKEVAVKQAGAIQGQDINAWGAAPKTSAKNLVVPGILLMQFMSEKVKSQEAQFAEYRDSLNNKKLGSITEGFEFIPFFLEEFWVEYNLIKKGSKESREFTRMLPIVVDPLSADYNDNLGFEDTNEQGQKMVRDRMIRAYVLLANDVKAGADFPYTISFRRTSLKAGRKLWTQMYAINSSAGKIPAAVAMELYGSKQSNDDGDYAVMDTRAKRDSTPEEMAAAFKWFKILGRGALKVDNSELEREAPPVKDVGTTEVSEQF